ncbi:hypothetical protein HYPBUDRAFT_156770 [Hyphopichia burtonii NRRL Y-1933]|uniref:C2H2-type domain-containing protein n=1 Tax=Hyphopichia burtonii NRRL Y-1933 TaxID=984485 RepID=A0A1E4RLE3_9ASCO|nr:hypothetical protein HYPBUDRAFT_156770 [Hyphopichia burtonii NRRL Y-1933]ODV68080.1 hypothetical protein HYPBUDRAFT_156770 [Hyphopichia burtonii NRRL Y-1933]
MELDESPPFTIELDFLYDTAFNFNQDPSNINSAFSNNDDRKSLNPGLNDHNLNSNIPMNSLYQDAHSNGFNFNDMNQDQNEVNSIVPSQDDRLRHSNSFLSVNNYDYDGTNHLGDQLHLRNASIDSYHNSNVSLHTGATQGYERSDNYDINKQYQNTKNLSVGLNNPNNSSISNNNYYGNDLSPLTTTTSLTPSVSSIHSTQPSFFSANQYFPRNSLDQSQSQSIHRASFDAYSKKRQSMDSQASANRTQPQRNQRYASFTNSISNYIPFMSDKNQQRSGPPSPNQASPTNFMPIQSNQQSKHLIRSIFKGNNNLNNNSNGNNGNSHGNNNNNNSNNQSTNNADSNNIFQNGIQNDGLSNGIIQGSQQNDQFIDGFLTDNDYFMTSPTKEEPELENPDQNTFHKKAKRSKRSLFTRFKTPIKQEPPIEEDNVKMEDLDIPIDQVTSANTTNNNTSDTLLNTPIKTENDPFDTLNGAVRPTPISRTPSAANSNYISQNYTSSLDQSHGNSSINIASQDQQINQNQGNIQPDYAALFEKVGKRKNIVNPSTYIKSKPKVKNENDSNNNLPSTSNNNSNSNTEKSSVLNVPVGDVHSNDHHLNISVSSSNASSSLNAMNINNDDADQKLTTSTSASTPNTNTTSSLANASMRILGSKLMLKKKNQKQQQKKLEVEQEKESQKEALRPDSRTSLDTSLKSMESEGSEDYTRNVATIISKGVEVEVDLKSLDLPPNTKIFPSSIINSKSRVRGRKENKEADLLDLSKIYLCNYCSRRFKRQEHLKRHFRSLHTFEKPYDCAICNKKFSRSDNLNQHLKIHKQEEAEAELARQKAAIKQEIDH